MAFQAQSALGGIASSLPSAIPSFPNPLTSPWRIFSRRHATRNPPGASDTSSSATAVPLQNGSAERTCYSPEDTKAMMREAFDIVTSLPRYEHMKEALKEDYTVQSILSKASKDASRLRPTAINPASIPGAIRQFSTASFRLGPFQLRSTPSLGNLNRSQRRMMSNQHTSRNVLAHLEQTANNNPSSASSQNAFYSALLRANMPDILVERYETGRYATNAACDAMYQRALERIGPAAGLETQPTSGAAPNRYGQGGLTQEQMHAIGRAVAVSQRGGSSATPMRGSDGAYGSGARSSPLHVVVDEPKGSIIFKIIRTILVYGTIGYFLLIVSSFAIEASGLLRKVGGPQSSEAKPEQQTTRFEDVKGCDEAIEELREVVDFLKSPDKYNQLGGKLPKGVLMVGPPGTGKTLLARAVAGEAGVPFFFMSGSEFDEVYVGVGAKRVRELFSNAKAKAPAIVFIDELDAVGGKRNERDAAYHMQTLNQMLTELDGFDQTSGVVFLAATNFPQMLDKALTRPGRFDRQITVPLPDVRGRVDILKYHTRKMQLETEVDPSVMARGTPGFSGADLENLVNQAAVYASKLGAKKIGMKHLDWARDKILMGAEKKNMVIQEEDKLMTAYHEAGHALVGHFTPGNDPLYKVTIMPRGQALGITFNLPELDKYGYSRREMLARIDRAMGGKAAEELIYGPDEVTSGCSQDLQQATDMAYQMVTKLGMGETLGSIAFDNRTYGSLSGETKLRVEAEVRRILDESSERARKVLSARKKELDLLAKGLIKYETVNKEEMEKLIRGEQLPDKDSAGPPSVPIKLPDISLPGLLGGKSAKVNPDDVGEVEGDPA